MVSDTIMNVAVFVVGPNHKRLHKKNINNTTLNNDANLFKLNGN